MAEILEIAKNGALKTQIMYKANLSFTQLNDYLKFMMDVGLLSSLNENGKDIYTATVKGNEFIQRFCELTELVKGESTKNLVKHPPRHLWIKI